MTRDELLAAYAEGRRDFIGARLRGANLLGTNLADANLAGANLECSYLRRTNLFCANLAGALESHHRLSRHGDRGQDGYSSRDGACRASAAGRKRPVILRDQELFHRILRGSLYYRRGYEAMKPANTNTPTKAWDELRSNEELLEFGSLTPCLVSCVKNPERCKTTEERERKAANMLWFLKFELYWKKRGIEDRRAQFMAVEERK